MKGDTTFEFVTEGAGAALARAWAAARGKNVLVMGGANLFGQYLEAGVIESPCATHLRYRPARERRHGGEVA